MIGDFEIEYLDLFGRVGKLTTKSGILKTPIFFPVVDPRKPELINEMKKMGIKAVITNAYFAYKLNIDDIHNFLQFPIIMTDSGAYQILKYGKIDVDQPTIIKYQEKIGSDIAVILDIPTGPTAERKVVEKSVYETIRRAHEWVNLKTREDILWVGPVQGGIHVDLVEISAREVSKLPFHIHAFGSPTELLETYEFASIIRSFLVARKILPRNRPIHLFGAGLPQFLSLAVAAGADMFDSASYILYARDGRYMTPHGVYRIENIDEFLCPCPICTKYTPKEIRESPESEKLIALHNLWVIITEMKIIRRAIIDGRLWELIENRARIHTRLYDAFKVITKYSREMISYTPLFKQRGLLYLSNLSIERPEVWSHIERLKNMKFRAKKMLILPPTEKPYYKKYEKLARKYFGIYQFFVFSKLFGLIPLEVSDVFPLSQHEEPKEMENSAEKVFARTFNALAKKFSEILVAYSEIFPLVKKYAPEAKHVPLEELTSS